MKQQSERADDYLSGSYPVKGEASPRRKATRRCLSSLIFFVFSSARLAPVELTIITVLRYVASRAVAVISGLLKGRFGKLILPHHIIIQGEKN